MATSLIRTCLSRIVPKTYICKVTGPEKKFKFAIFDLTCVQCSCYHTTPVYHKIRKNTEQRKKLQKLRELELLNPKIKKQVRVVDVWKSMTVAELADVTGHRINDILDVLYIIDKQSDYEGDSIFDDPAMLYETVRKLGLKFRIINPENIRRRQKEEEEEEDYDAVKAPPPDPSKLVKRHPVVTIMGHVDHGKTTLLDSLRHSSVVESEFGGITQHIGAFNVTLPSGEIITFLDTPGHAAFSTMRARGANCTDIVILVVAADDGVMEQTVQSIRMAKDAKVSIVVAVNKIDKPNVDIERAKRMLAEHDVLVEDLGGDVPSVNISALKGINLDGLIETVAAQAEVMDLKGDPSGLVEGVVIEASNEDTGRGKLATILVQRGTLRKGDIIVSGYAWAKVRSMFDHAGNLVTEAGLSTAVQVIGWREQPIAGDEILEVESEKRAQMVMRFRRAKLNELKSLEQYRIADQKLQEHLKEYHLMMQKRRILGVKRIRGQGPRQKEYVEDNFPKVNVIIKGDVVGSVEAIMDVLDTYSDEKRCRLSVVHYGVGPVNKTDVELAKAFKAIIYSFNTKVPKKYEDEVDIRKCNIIYRLIDDLKREITKQLPVLTVEEELGRANVLQEFEVNERRKKVKVAGCRCTKGVLKKSDLFKVVRGEEEIYKGKAVEIRHLKEVVDTIKSGFECGIKLENYDKELKNGDEIICFKYVDQFQQTDWSPGF